ncbi:MAG: enoyl-CoA hydratase/isomerase family protein [Thermodesulfobacteriota bacterium]
MSWKIELIDNVVIIHMNSNNMNLINNLFLHDLNDAFDIVEKEYSGCAVVLTSEGDVFSAGLDIVQSYSLFKEGNLEKIESWYEQFRDSLIRVFSFQKPLIAAVNGHAIAGGLVLALCCDYRIACNSNARFGLNEVTIGFPLPSVTAEILSHVLGARVAERVILSGTLYENEDALKLGLFHELSHNDDLLELALGYAKQYNKSQIAAYGYTKKILRKNTIDRIIQYSTNIDMPLPELLSSENTVGSLGRLLESLKNK